MTTIRPRDEAAIAEAGIETPGDFWIEEVTADSWSYRNADGWQAGWGPDGWTVIDPDDTTTHHEGDRTLREARAAHRSAP